MFETAAMDRLKGLDCPLKLHLVDGALPNQQGWAIEHPLKELFFPFAPLVGVGNHSEKSVEDRRLLHAGVDRIFAGETDRVDLKQFDHF